MATLGCSRLARHNPPDLLTSVEQVRALDSRGLTSHLRARISGRVTYVDGLRDLFLQDPTGGMLVDYPNVEVELKAGQQVEITGDITRSHFNPAMIGQNVRLIAPSNVTLKPLSVQAANFNSPSLQYSLVELQGIVRSAGTGHTDRGAMSLFTCGRTVGVSIRDMDGLDYLNLVDAAIGYAACCG